MQKKMFLNTNNKILLTLVIMFWLAACSNIVLAESVPTPAINDVAGNIVKDKIIIIRGTGFTEKKNALPLLWWKADIGKAPSKLGRKTMWDGAFNGALSTDIVEMNSSKSVVFDHGISSGAALGQVNFSSDKIYLHRKRYENFDVVKNVAIRTRAIVTSSTVPASGDIITGRDSLATGKVSQVFAPDTAGGSYTIYYTNIVGDGTINDTKPRDFQFGETMDSSNGAVLENKEGSSKYPTGTFRSFNNKIVRIWSENGGNNCYIGAQGSNDNLYNLIPSNTDSDIYNGDFTNHIKQIPKSWVTEEVEYKTSAIDASDGLFKYYQNGLLATDQTIITRSTARPGKYAKIFQSQVSNGAQIGSKVYYDSLYIDDTWHRVIICNGKTLDQCSNREIQIPTSWSDNEITVRLNLGRLNLESSIFLYVLDENGVPNSSGWALCPKCPLPPTPNF